MLEDSVGSRFAHHEHLWYHVLNFLDPISISRCRCVNRTIAIVSDRVIDENICNYGNDYIQACKESKRSPDTKAGKDKIMVYGEDVMEWFGRSTGKFREASRVLMHAQYSSRLTELADGAIAAGCFPIKHTIDILDTRKRKRAISNATINQSTSVIKTMRSSDKINNKGNANGDVNILRRLEGHQRQIWVIIELFDGRLASCSNDPSIFIWGECTSSERKKIPHSFSDLEKKYTPTKPPRVNTIQLKGHTSSINEIIQLKDSRIVSSSQDMTIRVWDINTNECEMVLKPGSYAVLIRELSKKRLMSVAFSNDCILIWNLKNGKVIEKFQDEGAILITDCVDDSLLVTTNEVGTITIREIEYWDTLQQLTGHATWVTQIAQLQDRKKFLSSSLDGTLRLWNYLTGECLHLFEQYISWIRTLPLQNHPRYPHRVAFYRIITSRLRSGTSKMKVISSVYKC